jgi:hypothetical protein
VRGMALLVLFAAAGCGSNSSDSGSPAEASGISARFTEQTVFGGRDGFTETVRGAFDWSTNTGWAIRRTDGHETRSVQLGELCYRRFPGERWKRSRADDVDGLCDPDLFHNPATEDDLVRSVAADWMKVGSETIRGVPTTHYRAGLNVGAVKGTVEMWVDRAGVVRRDVQRGQKTGDYESVRDYFDIGTLVRVKAPKLRAGG